MNEEDEEVFDSDLLLEIEGAIGQQAEIEISKYISEYGIETCTPEKIYELLNVDQLQTDLYTKRSKLVTHFLDGEQMESENEMWSHVNELDNMNKLVDNLGNRSHAIRLKALEHILAFQVIETKQNYWEKLSKALQDCFLSSRDDIFIDSLQVYFRIISSPGASSAGFLSLLQGTMKLGNSKYMLENLREHRLTKCLKVILSKFKFIIHQMQLSKEKANEEILLAWVNLLSVQSRFNSSFKVLEILSKLDSRAKWLDNICACVYIRESFFNTLEKKPEVIKITFYIFVETLTESEKPEPLKSLLDFFEHSANFVLSFLSFKAGIDEGIVYKRRNGDELTIFNIIEVVFLWISRKNVPSIAEILRNFVTRLFKNNFNLLTSEGVHIIMSPFQRVNSRNVIDVLQSNQYILDLVNCVAGSKNPAILANCFQRTKSRSIFTRSYPNGKNSPSQVIFDVAVALIRNYINGSESDHDVYYLTKDVLQCCNNLLQSHPIYLFLPVIKKLLLSLRDFFKTLRNHGHQTCIRHHGMDLVLYIMKHLPEIEDILNDDLFLIGIMEEIFTLYAVDNLIALISNLSKPDILNELVQKNYKLIITNNIDKCWFYRDEENVINISKSTSLIEELNHFCFLLFSLSYSTQGVTAFLIYENENTLVGSENIGILTDLIERSLEFVNSTTVESAVGLVLIKILLSNLDVFLYLESRYNVQKKLQNIERESTNNGEVSPQEFNECAIICHNLLLALDYIGYPNKEINRNIYNSNISLPRHSRSGSSLRRKNTQNEFLKFLQTADKSCLHDYGWILQARKMFKTACFEYYNLSLFVLLLEQIPKSHSSDKKPKLAWPNPDDELSNCFPEDEAGILIITKFGIEHGLLNQSFKNEENLALLIKQIRFYIGYSPSEFAGFDWFVAVIFLMCGGNLEKCKSCIMNFSDVSLTTIIWWNFGKHLDNKTQSSFFQKCLVVLADSFVYSGMQMNDLKPDLIMKRWISQCFFNILPFREICNFIIYAILHPPEYLIYYMVVLFNHTKNGICNLVYKKSFENMLNMISLENFKLGEYFSSIEKLSKEYKNVRV